MIEMRNILPISDFKTGLAGFVKQLRSEHQTMVVTQNGQPAMVVMAPEEYELLQVRIQALTLHTAYDKASENFNQGRYLSFDSGKEILHGKGRI